MSTVDCEAPPHRPTFTSYPAKIATAKAASPPQTHMWEQLRKEARKLEGELDVKLAAYAKLCSGWEQPQPGRKLSTSAAEQVVQTKAKEIESLLQRLSDVNDGMGGAISGGDVRQHTLSRHRDILQEFAQEFRRLTASRGAARDRAELLAGSGDAAPLLGVQVQSSGGTLLRERNTIASSTAAVDDLITQAQTVMGGLTEQRSLFENIGAKVVAVGSKFPVINGLLSGIYRRRNKDTIVLTLVIAVCTILLLLYVMLR